MSTAIEQTGFQQPSGAAEGSPEGRPAGRRASVDRRRSSHRLSFQTYGAPMRVKRNPGASSQPLPENEFLHEIEGSQAPRFTSTLSIAAQYAILKGYEDQLRNRIQTHYPEFSNVLQSSPSPPSDLKGKTIALRGMKARSASAIDHRPEKDNFQLADSHQKAMTTSRVRLDLPEDKQMELSQRFQYAQYLNDFFVHRLGEPSLYQQTFSAQKNFNAIKKFNWWSAWWATDFTFEDEDD